METKFTKGKWIYKATKDRITVVIPTRQIPTILTFGYISDDDCNNPDCCKKEEHANAKIASFSPELLEALNHTLEIMYKCECPKELQEEYANAYMNYSELIKTATE